MKDPTFLTRFSYFVKYPRFLVIFSSIAAVIYIFSISMFIEYYNTVLLYSRWSGYYRYRINKDNVIMFLLISQAFYSIILMMVKRKPVAALYTYVFNLLFFNIIILVLVIFSFYIYNSQFMLSTLLTYTTLSLTPIINMLPVYFFTKFVRQFPKSYKAILAAGVSPKYYDLDLVRDAYLMIAGYQRYVENVDEDGWE